MHVLVAIVLTLLLEFALASPGEAAGLQTAEGRIALGENHSCALTAFRGVVCWGENDEGQLGGASSALRIRAPVPVVGLSHGVAAIAAHHNNTCALTTGGGVLCWGRNAEGQLGDGTTVASDVPVPVTGLSSGVAAIAAGDLHTCALTTDGDVWCWGRNNDGQLGDGTTVSSSVPVPVIGLPSDVSVITAGGGHTCAITAGGGVQCWGWNEYGQLGDGTTADSSAPVAVAGLSSDVSAIAGGGAFNCAITPAGVQCWGSNTLGQLGDGTLVDSSVPVPVSGLPGGAAKIAAGTHHTCMVTTGGNAVCWGRNATKQLGSDDGLSLGPVTITSLPKSVVTIALGRSHTCALTTGGGAWCWGDNPLGQLGIGTSPFSYEPSQVIGLESGVAALTAGQGHSCALTTEDAALCWGTNSYGQLGDGTITVRSVPVPVSGLSSDGADIAAGRFHSCALTTGGAASCWGKNFNGQLGDGTRADSLTPVPVSGLSSGVTALTTGDYHTCALTTGGGASCWGFNNRGQLGDGTTVRSSVPVPVTGLSSGVAALAAGGSHTCALTTGGAILCWGYNIDGQLGDGTNLASSVPVPVTALPSDVAALAAGASHTCALTTGGGAHCWGYNFDGQLGDGTNLSSSVPVPVTGLSSGVAAIDPGRYLTCALTTDGDVWCWGRNNGGQLGDGTNVSSSVPVPVIGLPSDVSVIAAGGGHTCAITAGGGVQCWGAGGASIGNGYVGRSADPLPVVGFGPLVPTVPVLGAYGLALLATALLAAGARHTRRRS